MEYLHSFVNIYPIELHITMEWRAAFFDPLFLLYPFFGGRIKFQYLPSLINTILRDLLHLHFHQRGGGNRELSSSRQMLNPPLLLTPHQGEVLTQRQGHHTNDTTLCGVLLQTSKVWCPSVVSIIFLLSMRCILIGPVIFLCQSLIG